MPGHSDDCSLIVMPLLTCSQLPLCLMHPLKFDGNRGSGSIINASKNTVVAAHTKCL